MLQIPAAQLCALASALPADEVIRRSGHDRGAGAGHDLKERDELERKERVTT